MINIAIDKFEGPLSLLLKLIEKEEMDITEVSLAKIADQYTEYIRKSEKITPEMMADFLVVAASLLLIKSKALLPYLTPEEEEEIEEFEERLKMYKEFLEASKEIEKLIGNKKFMFCREFNRKVVLNSMNIFSPPKKLKKQDVNTIFNEILERIRPQEKELEEKKLEHKINIEDKILHIQKNILKRMQMSFHEMLTHANNKTEVIVSFLAMLELVKQRDVIVEQGELFEDIIIMKNE